MNHNKIKLLFWYYSLKDTEAVYVVEIHMTKMMKRLIRFISFLLIYLNLYYGVLLNLHKLLFSKSDLQFGWWPYGWKKKIKKREAHEGGVGEVSTRSTQNPTNVFWSQGSYHYSYYKEHYDRIITKNIIIRSSNINFS